MIIPGLCNDLIDDADSEIKLNARKTRDERYLYWMKYNS